MDRSPLYILWPVIQMVAVNITFDFQLLLYGIYWINIKFYDLNTMGIQIPDLSVIQMVNNCLDLVLVVNIPLNLVWYLNSIWKPDQYSNDKQKGASKIIQIPNWLTFWQQKSHVLESSVFRYHCTRQGFEYSVDPKSGFWMVQNRLVAKWSRWQMVLTKWRPWSWLFGIRLLLA